jgi:ssDNA-binding replication factor A large subunit
MIMKIHEIITFIKNDNISKQDLIEWLEVMAFNEKVNKRRDFIKILNSKNIKIIFDENGSSIGFSINHPQMVFVDFDSIDKIKSYSSSEYYKFISHIKDCNGN